MPRAADRAEDDGWLMGFVLDAAARTTALQILDAQQFSAAPLSTVSLPHLIPAGFHRNGLPATAGV